MPLTILPGTEKIKKLKHQLADKQLEKSILKVLVKKTERFALRLFHFEFPKILQIQTSLGILKTYEYQ